MDFRNCPACQASVLEDDAEQCPFCGASMTTGKPMGAPQAAAKQPPATSRPAAAAESPKPTAKAGTRPAAAARPTTRKVSSEGDPFDVDTSSARKAFPVRPKPAKGFMVRIACPMCERAGFISDAQYGKEVKCCNPDCLVPVFIAKSPKAEAAPEEPQSDGNGKLIMAGLGVVVAASVIGAVVYVMNNAAAKQDAPLQPSEHITAANRIREQESAAQTTTPEAPVTMTSQQIVTKTLEEMQRVAEFADSARERSQVARLMAESYFLSDKADRAKTELASLTGASQYTAIAPHVVSVWKSLAAKNDVAAKAAVEEAWKLKGSLPPRGREALDIAGSLAAALEATGRDSDARQLAAAENDPEAGEFCVQWRAAIDGGNYRFDQVWRRSALHELADSQWINVTQTLIGKKQYEAAMNWAKAGSTRVVRENAAAVIATQLAVDLGNTAELGTFAEQLASGLEPSGVVRIWSGIGQGLLERGDEAGAKEAASKAAAALQGIPVEAPLAVPEMLPLYELAETEDKGLPDPFPSQAAALAAYDLYVLNSGLKDQAAAGPQLELALRFLRSGAPSAKATRVLANELEKSAPAVQRKLAQALNLDNAVIVSRFSRYQAQVRDWHQRATDRLDLEVRLLRRAALAGDVASTWNLIRSAEEATEPNETQAYYSTSLPAILRQRAADLKLPQIEAEMTAAFTARRITPPLPSPTDQALVKLAHPDIANDPAKIVAAAEPYYRRPAPDRFLVDAALLAAVMRLQAQQPDAALELAGKIPDLLLREDALWLVGARTALNGQAEKLITTFSSRGLPRAAVVSMYRGVIDALTTSR